MQASGGFRHRKRSTSPFAEPGWHGPWDPELAAGRFSGRSPRWVRLWLPVIVSFFVQVPAVFVQWRAGHRLDLAAASTTDLAIGVALALVGPVALIGARRFPGPVVAVVGLAASADLLLAGDTDGPPYIAFAFAIGSAIVRGARLWAWISIGATWVATIVLSSVFDLGWQPWRIVGITIGILLLVGLAEGVRNRTERMERFRTMVATRRQTEVQAERVRIARELHDVLAHSLSQINVQASVGLHLMEKQPDQAAAALASIKETSKTALDEVRSVLGVLRAEDPNAPLVPEPDLSRLAGLAASVTSQGVAVTLSDTLAGVDKPTQLAMYRIVQESLTNVVRHANATTAVVTLAEADGRYTVTIRDNGVADTHSRGAVSEGGRGLLGMRERAELLGGKLEAGRQPGGGFLVSATIPKRSNPNEESPR